MPELPDLGQIKTYFDTRIQEHGASPRGSDWNGEESQNIRFDQILKVIEGNTPFRFLIMAVVMAHLPIILKQRVSAPSILALIF